MGYNSGTNEQIMIYNNCDVSLINMIAYIKFGEILSIVLKILNEN